MSATPVSALPLGPLDPERSELLLRVVDGLEPATLQWLSGFAAGVAHERALGGPGVSLPVGPVAAPAARAPSRIRPTANQMRLPPSLPLQLLSVPLSIS